MSVVEFFGGLLGLFMLGGMFCLIDKLPIVKEHNRARKAGRRAAMTMHYARQYSRTHYGHHYGRHYGRGRR